MGAYKYEKAPKYRKATKIPESTYKYQKAMENIGKMRVIALCMNYKLLFLYAWIMIDAHKCSTLVKSMVYVPTNAIIHLMTLVLVDYSRLWIKLSGTTVHLVDVKFC